MLVSSLVLSRLDYCNAVLAGSPQVLLIKFKEWSAAQLASFSEFLNLPTSPLFSVISTGNQSAARFTTKIALTCFYIVSGTAPPHLSELLHIYSPSCCLCSASDIQILCVPRIGRKTQGETSFQYIKPVIWNSLPLSVRHSSLSSLSQSRKPTCSLVHTN